MLTFGPTSSSATHALRDAWAGEQATRLRAAVAFATEGGVTAIEAILGDAFEDAQKQWIIGIDNGFTQPEALRKLADLPNSEVRVHDAVRTMRSPILRGPVFFHPKIFGMDSGGASLLVVSTSANLTEGGLLDNLEQYLGWRGAKSDPIGKTFDRWWRRTWKASDLADKALIDAYEKKRQLVKPAVVPAAAAPLAKPKGPIIEAEPAPSDLQKSKWMWVEAVRPLEGGSQNQLELLLTAHHFFYAVPHPPKTQAKQLTFQDKAGNRYTNPNRQILFNGPPLRKKGNSMWRVYLPTHTEGFDGYQGGGVLIRFTRTATADHYVVEVARTGSSTAKRWQANARKMALIPGPPARRVGWH